MINSVLQVMIDMTKIHYTVNDLPYHNWSHIQYMLDVARKEKIQLTATLIMSIGFHDIVYDPKRDDNELKSYEFYLSKFGSVYWVQSAFNEQVCRNILSTRFHLPWDIESSIMIDLDLYILGDEWEVYQKYSEDIKKEYSFLSEEEYVKGRSKFLKDMLGRRLIYWSQSIKHREDLARSNMTNELELLNGGTL